MSVIEKATAQMEAWAANPTQGYDQANRWGPDYDCSSAVISAWELAGVPVKTNGATYTGNMRGVFLRTGFTDVTASVNLASGTGLKRGDVLLNVRNHTAMYCGNGMEVEASINEKGTTTGGQSGDQTGREFLKRSYRNYPWDCVLRYTGASSAGNSGSTQKAANAIVTLPMLRQGDKNATVKSVQQLLIAKGFSCGEHKDDGEFGRSTGDAVEAFQRANGLTADRVVGPATYKKLMGA